MKGKSKTPKGITLIALIITVVLLLILAVVAIQEITGDGIITYAITATENHKMAQLKEDAELVKMKAQTEYFMNGRTLNQAELLRLINEHFEGSTIEGNAVITEEGKYKIVVDENLNITVEKAEEGSTDAEDIDVSYTVSKTNNGHNINLRIDLVGLPEYDSTKFGYEYLEYEYLPGMTAEQILTLGGSLLGVGPDVVYDELIKSNVDDMAYEDFITEQGDAKVLEKHGYPSAASYVKLVMIQSLTESAWIGSLYVVHGDGAKVVYSKKLLPDLVGKTEEEIKSTVEGWYNNEKTFDTILTEITGKTTLEEYRAQLNYNIDVGVESIKFFTREHALIYVAGQAYTRTHPVVVTKPDGSTQNIDWFARNYVTTSYATTEAGEYVFEVTSPSGQKEKITALIDGIKLDKTEITNGKIGGTETLTASLINVEGEITWTTSNESVAVAEGTGTSVNVVIKSKGEATITVACGEYSATCKITQLEGKITLDKTETTKTIKKGEELTEELTASLTNIDGEITWTTSNEDVATIEGTGTSVNIVIKSKGEAIITATCGSYSVTCTVKAESREGQTVKYDSNMDGTPEDWIILTDRIDLVEIISKSAIGSLTLGYDDQEIKGNLLKYLDLDNDNIPDDLNGDGEIEEGDIDYNKDGYKTSDPDDIAIASYNNAITTINNYCKSLVTATDNEGVRSVGGSIDIAKYHTFSEFSKKYFEVEDLKVKESDDNGDADRTQIESLGYLDIRR